MSSKNKHIKKIVIVIILLLVFISSKLFIEGSHDSSPIPKIITKTTVFYPSINIKSQTLTVPTNKKREETNKLSVKNTRLGNLPLIEVFKCDMSIDEDLVEQVRQTLELYSYETSLKTQKHQINELLAIRVISSDLPINFRNSINEKIKLILLLYKKWFGLALKEPITLNFVLLPNMENYSDVLSTLSIDSPNSQGLFWANSNFAFAAYRTEQQLEQTIIHELVHALNFYLVGYSARWLTEGLADYFEKIEFRMEEEGYIYSLNLDKKLTYLHL